MFLLSRLDDISRLFPEDVERTREFLLDRGIPAGSLEALTHFSARLAIDPSFRRDVTSLVHVVIQREHEAVDYMDLLGILVVATAGPGPFKATGEQEESVREMLRFLTQIPRQTGPVGPVFVRYQNVVTVAVGAKPLLHDRLSPPAHGGDHITVRPDSTAPSFMAQEPIASRWRGPVVSIAAVIALAVAMGSGWMGYQKSRKTLPVTAPLVASSPGMPVNDEKYDLAKAPPAPLRKPQAPMRKPSPAVARTARGLRTPLAASPTSKTAAPVRPLQFPDASQTIPLIRPTPSAGPAVVAANNPPARPLSAVPESPAITTPPPNTTPSVRRRLPKWVVINPAPLRRPGGVSVPASTTPGVVHPASIGMMATNLISSPAPEYPVAASQARVQGEVKVRAVVDRQGNVIEARVVSGPELLRDASLEAVQHWRYRPYIQGGKPVEVATTAVLDFELP